MRKTAVVVPAVPQFVQAEQVVTDVLFLLNVGNKAVAHRHRIKENTVRVLQYAEFILQQGIANVFGKAGAHRKYFLLVVDLPGRFGNIYIEHQVHTTQIV